MPTRHLIITGTGRAGTTFLVQLLTALGLPTGFSGPEGQVFENSHAGMEIDLATHPDPPYIVKSPFLCDSLDGLLTSGKITVDHALVPVRSLFAAAESRRAVSRRDDAAGYIAQFGAVPGGLCGTQVPADQERILTERFYRLVHTLATHDVPHTFLTFPRIVQDARYLYSKLSPVLADLDFATFEPVFQRVSRPELVHDFEMAQTPVLPGRDAIADSEIVKQT
jgi:hypothetical protein